MRTQQLDTATEERCFLCSPCRDVTRISRTVEAMSQLRDIHRPIRTKAEDIVKIRYQESASENRLRKHCVCSSDL
jgi:hypothetical protein